MEPPWSYGSWIYNYMYLCNQCLSPLMLRVQILIRARCTTLCDKVCQWLVTGWWFSPVSSINKTDCHDITETLLKVALNTTKHTNKQHNGAICQIKLNFIYDYFEEIFKKKISHFQLKTTPTLCVIDFICKSLNLITQKLTLSILYSKHR